MYRVLDRSAIGFPICKTVGCLLRPVLHLECSVPLLPSASPERKGEMERKRGCGGEREIMKAGTCTTVDSTRLSSQPSLSLLSFSVSLSLPLTPSSISLPSLLPLYLLFFLLCVIFPPFSPYFWV